MSYKRYKVGDRVIAIRNTDGNTKDKRLFVFGAGVYAGDFPVPGVEIEGFTNPRIDLDNGKKTWGMECWWGAEDKVRSDFPETEWTWVEVEPELAP